MIIENEVWKDIAGYEGRYQVSNMGNVRRASYTIAKDDNSYTVPDTLLRPHIDGDYLYVNFDNRSFAIHRLVGKAFLDNPEDRYTLYHKDGNKFNNRSDNLEWSIKKFHGKTKPPVYRGKKVKCLDNGKIYDNMKQAAEDTHIGYERISHSAYTGAKVKGHTFVFV